MSDPRSYPETAEAIRRALHNAVDSIAIAKLARLFHPQIVVAGESYSQSVVDILLPRLVDELGTGDLAQASSERTYTLAEVLKSLEAAIKELGASSLSSTEPRCTCAAIVNPNIPHARTCPLSSPQRGGQS
jgi:hypothetical protein